MMLTCNAISFELYRMENTLVNNAMTTTETSHGILPNLLINSISIDKQAVKIYYPYGNQKSIYDPTGMQGPVLKLKGYTTDLAAWREVYTNDILRVIAFEFPIWNVEVNVGSDWWVDIKTMDASVGHVHNGEIHFMIEIDLYKRG